MKALILVGLLALTPAAVHPAQPAPTHARFLSSLVCSGDGLTRRIAIPVRGDQSPSRDDRLCWAKGCHGGHPRKRIFRLS